NGLRWKRDQRVFIGIKNTVKHFMKKYQKDAPAQVENAMKMFVELPDQIMEHQHKIEESVLEGIKYMKNMGYRGIVTEDDMNQIKKIRNEMRSEEHTSELQSRENLVCRLLLEKKKNKH